MPPRMEDRSAASNSGAFWADGAATPEGTCTGADAAEGCGTTDALDALSG